MDLLAGRLLLGLSGYVSVKKRKIAIVIGYSVVFVAYCFFKAFVLL